jgi:hypothetical protein
MKYLSVRQDYRGGWPLGYMGAECQEDTPVECTIRFGFTNLNCCPSGQTCQDNVLQLYCCPSDADCGSAVNNRPACADPSWQLYSLGGGYFCCQEGYIGVLPIDGSSGLCESNIDGLPKSRIASLVTTSTATGTDGSGSTQSTATGGAIQTTDSDGKGNSNGDINVPSGNDDNDRTPGGTTSGDPRPGASSSEDSNPSNSNEAASSGNGEPSISAGAIAGIVVGGIILIALCAGLLLWYHHWSMNRNRGSKLQRENMPPPQTVQHYQPGLIAVPQAQDTGPTPPPPPQYSPPPQFPSGMSAQMVERRPVAGGNAGGNTDGGADVRSEPVLPEFRSGGRQVSEAEGRQTVREEVGGTQRVEMPITRE